MSMTFKEIIESYGKELAFSCTAYKPNGDLYRDITEKDIVSVNPHFDGALYTCVMRCFDIVLVGDHRTLEKESMFLDCSLTAKKGDESSVINYGTFFVGEAPEFDEAENTTKFICYDATYKTTKPYALKATFPITLKNYAKAIFDACGLTCANLDELKNGSKEVAQDRYSNATNDSGSAYTYRDVLDDIAKSAGCSFAFKSDANGENVDEIYVIYVTDGNGNMKKPLYTLDISNFKTLTIGEKYGPVNAVTFSRQPQEDNVYYKPETVTDENAVEVRLTQPLTAEGTDEERAEWLPEIFKAVNGTEYQCYSLESYGIGFLNFGDVFTIRSFKRNGLVLDYNSTEDYLSVFMRMDMVIDGNIKESSKLEMPVATSTDYKAATTLAEKKLFQAWMKVDKQLGLIESVVYDPTTGKSRIEQNAQSILAAVEGIDKINKAGYITETAAKSLIETNNNTIAMTVAGKLSIGTRNILFDSECFESLPVGFHGAELKSVSGLPGDVVLEESSLPSGKSRNIVFSEKPSIEGGISGITFGSLYTIGEAAGAIKRISAGKTYTLSFLLKGAAGTQGREINRRNLIYAGTGVDVNYISSNDLSVSQEWKRYIFTFSFSENPKDFILRFTTVGIPDSVYSLSISSLKLEEGNVATDWTPNVQDIEKSVEAKLELCVKTDEEGNLLSAIHAKANQITIESDKFTLDADGKMTCKGATIEDGSVDIGNELERVKIEDGRISFEGRNSAEDLYEATCYLGSGLGGLIANADYFSFNGLNSANETVVDVCGELKSDRIVAREAYQIEYAKGASSYKSAFAQFSSDIFHLGINALPMKLHATEVSFDGKLRSTSVNTDSVNSGLYELKYNTGGTTYNSAFAQVSSGDFHLGINALPLRFHATSMIIPNIKIKFDEQLGVVTNGGYSGFTFGVINTDWMSTTEYWTSVISAGQEVLTLAASVGIVLDSPLIYAQKGSWNEVDVSSTENIKTNIKTTDKVLELFGKSRSQIYNYNLIKQKKPAETSSDEFGTMSVPEETVEVEENVSYGFVIGDGYIVPSEVLSEDGKHINLYSMASINWKATQELYEELIHVKARISELENQLSGG